MDEIEYERQQEEVAMGQAIAANVKAIFDDQGCETMAGLQRRLYKDTDAGIAISFELHNGSYVYVGDARAHIIKDPWNWIRCIGASSIVEGSDAEVEGGWIDCADAKYMEEGGEQLIVADFDALCKEVNDEACALWDEAHPDGVP